MSQPGQSHQQGQDPISSQIVKINEELEGKPGMDDNMKYCLESEKVGLNRRRQPRETAFALAFVR